MRRGRGGVVMGVVCAVGLLGAQPVWADHVPPPLWKLLRCVMNTTMGLPSEIMVRAATGGTDGEASTFTGTVANVASGAAMGVGWGVVRMGSGLVDILTFPVPFDDNRPLLEPEFAF